MSQINAPLTVALEDDALVIRIGIGTLAFAARHGDWAHTFDDHTDAYVRNFAITDEREFAKDVQRMLLNEKEDGSTPISDLLDHVSEDAVNDGSLGCEFDNIAIAFGEHGKGEPPLS